MFHLATLFHDTKDLIHAVAYDFHGKRIATCSSDQSVKIWDLNDKGNWVISSSWKTHCGSVWRVTWAHPEFGQVIATCSFDRTVAIFEEVVDNRGGAAQFGVGTHGGGGGGDRDGGAGTAGGLGGARRSYWERRAQLLDSRSNVTDVKFSPKHLGLQLAFCSANGVLRVYEAPDIMNLISWNPSHEIKVTSYRCSSVSWSTSRHHPPLIAVGCDDTNAPGSRVFIYEYNDTSKKWSKAETLAQVTKPAYDVQFAPHIGRSYHLLAVASQEVELYALKPIQFAAVSSTVAALSTPGSQTGDSEGGDLVTKFEVTQLASFDAHENKVWRVSWNITGTVLASTGSDGTVKLWKANYMGAWKPLLTLKSDGDAISQEYPE